MADSRLQIIISAVAGKAQEVLTAIGDRVSVMGDEFTIASDQAKRAMQQVGRSVEETKVQVDELAAKHPTVDAKFDDVRALEELKFFKDQMDSIRNVTAEIKLRDYKARAELDRIKVQMEDLRRIVVSIDLNDDSALYKVEDMQAHALALEQQLRSLMMRVNDEDALRKIYEVRTALVELHGDDSFKIHANNKEALMAIAQVKAAEDALKTAPKASWLSRLFGGGKRAKKNDPTGFGQLITALQGDLTDPTKAREAEVAWAGASGALYKMVGDAKHVALSTGEAKDAMEQFQARADELGKKLASFDLSSPGATAAAMKLQAEALALRKDLARIPTSLETEEAQAQIAALRGEAKSLEGELNGGGAAGAGANAAKAGGGMGVLAAVGLGALPTIAPLGAAAGNAIMGLASAFTAAGAGVVGFGAVAMGNLKAVFTAATALHTAQAAYATANTASGRTSALQQEAQAMYGLDGAQVKAVQTLTNFENQWRSFAHSFQTPVFTVFELALQGVETLMTDMHPVIAAAGQAFTVLFTQMDKGLKSGDNKQFFQWLASTAGPAIIAFGHSAGNVMRGFANLMMAFSPSAKSMENGLVSMTHKFYKWTDALAGTKGFKEFLTYAATSGKAAMGAIGGLAKIIGELLVAVAPVGLQMLKLVKNLANVLSTALRTNPALRVLVGAVVLAAAGVLKLANWLLTLNPRITQWATGIGAVVGAFFALNAASGILRPLLMFLRILPKEQKAWTLATGLSTLAQKIWNSSLVLTYRIQALYGLELLKNTARLVGQKIATVAVSVATRAWAVAQGIVNAVMDANPIALIIIGIAALIAVIVLVVKHWQAVVTWLKQAWHWFTHLGLGVKILITIFAPFLVLAGLVISHWRPIEKFFVNMWNRITQGFKAFMGIFRLNWSQLGMDIGNEMQKWIRQGLTWGENLIHMLAQGILNGLHWVTHAASAVIGQVKAFLGFGSPTEKGPGATSDMWAPNFMKMYTQGFLAGIPQMQGAAMRVAQTLEKTLNPGVLGTAAASPAAMGQTAATTFAQDAAQQGASSGPLTIHTEVHFHGANLSDPKQVEKFAQQVAFYNQQKLRAAGVTR
ncbi:hypothetical protein [Alicyclobacillus sp. ALC3]|uniref:hypothetical protein n=1 Tax=Alicyclobacillus sp. ALC3 TaxID=2796143 RepID=UPI002378B71B|nr:hypothetical protein [Alicyclobacillus sp. ALC3]WDL97797.1 hypothetical protein JC200_03440 [Alicyclobacillus sp. ALC3]